jgi:hypothetical protein
MYMWSFYECRVAALHCDTKLMYQSKGVSLEGLAPPTAQGCLACRLDIVIDKTSCSLEYGREAGLQLGGSDFEV